MRWHWCLKLRLFWYRYFWLRLRWYLIWHLNLNLIWHLRLRLFWLWLMWCFKLRLTFIDTLLLLVDADVVYLHTAFFISDIA